MVLLLTMLSLAQAVAAPRPTVVFVCEHGAAKSVIATEYFNKIAAEQGLRARATYRGVSPQADLSVSALQGLREDGFTPGDRKPSPITQGDVDSADVIFAIGCTLPLRATASGKADTWDDVPEDQGYAGTRDAIKRHVERLVDELLKKQRLAAPGSAVPRAADGHPDLEGVWNFSTITPLERPAEFAGQAFLTDAEAAAYESRTIERNNRDTREPSADADVASAYNEFWWDRGVHAARVDGRTRTSLIVDPPDGRVPALTPDGQRRAAARAEARRLHPADGPEDRSLGERCLLFNAGPPMVSGPYNNYVQILQTRDHVVILNEMIHDSRVVPLDGRPHLPGAIRRLLGDSRGRWDGNTLVIETTNFSDRTNVRGSGERLRLVEKFTRADVGTLLYEFTVDDPESFVKPWTAILPMAKTGDQIYEYACHEGNYAMTGILRGARAGEKKP